MYFLKYLLQIFVGKLKVKSLFDIMLVYVLGGNVYIFVDFLFYLIILIVLFFIKFFIVRNLFECLYFGYVDKIFSFYFVYIGKYIVVIQRKNVICYSKNCGYDVIFVEFVRYVIKGE